MTSKELLNSLNHTLNHTSPTLRTLQNMSDSATGEVKRQIEAFITKVEVYDAHFRTLLKAYVISEYKVTDQLIAHSKNGYKIGCECNRKKNEFYTLLRT